MGNETTKELERGQTGAAEATARPLNRAEERVAEKLRRARLVASIAAPDLTPTLDDLTDLAEMIEDEGG